MSEPTPAPDPPLRNPETSPHRRILLVEDDRRALEILRQTLEGRGFLVQTFIDGQRALDWLHEAQGTLPDLVVLDIRLPRRNGFLICQALRNRPRTRELPIILISEQMDLDGRAQGLQLGADDLICKPFYPKELILRIQRLLHRADLTRELSGRVRMLGRDVKASRESARAARRDALRMRRRLMERIGHLAGALRCGGSRGVEEALGRLLSSCWGETPFVYLERHAGGSFRPAFSRGVPPRAMCELVFPADPAGATVPVSTVPVFLDSIPEDTLLGRMRLRFISVGLHILIPAHLQGETVGILALGERASHAASGEEEIPLIQSALLVFDALWRRARCQARDARHVEWMAARWIHDCEAGDPRLRGHSLRVCDLCARLAERMGLGMEEMETIRLAGLLHRVAGGCSLGQERTSGRLISPLLQSQVIDNRSGHAGFARIIPQSGSSDAMCATESGSSIGDRASTWEDNVDSVSAILLHRTEQWNGEGGPLGLARSSIPLGARILAVAESYVSALDETEDRQRALHSVWSEAGRRLDPEIVGHLSDLIRRGVLVPCAPSFPLPSVAIESRGTTDRSPAR